MMRFIHIDNDWHEKVSLEDGWDDEDEVDPYEGAQPGSKITISGL
jgi:hypothetical protein